MKFLATLAATLIAAVSMCQMRLGLNAPSYYDMDSTQRTLMANVGNHDLRIIAQWYAIEKSPGTYSFTSLDYRVNSNLSHGYLPLMTFGWGNTYYTPSVHNGPTTSSAINAFAKCFTATVGHYKGHGIAFDIWNEPDQSHFWNNPDPVAYSNAMYAAAKMAKTKYPNETIVGFGGVSASNLTFMSAALAAHPDLFNYVDGVDNHPYGDLVDPWVRELWYSRIQALIAQYNPTNKNIGLYASEWGWSTNSMDPAIAPKPYTTDPTVNLVTNSNMTGAGWTRSGCSVTGGMADPDGGNNAYALDPSVATGGFGLSYNPGYYPTAGYYTASVWLKTDGPVEVISLASRSSAGEQIYIDGNWRRVSVTMYNDGSVNRILKFAWSDGALHSRFYAYHAQVESNGNLTSTQLTALKEQHQADLQNLQVQVFQEIGMSRVLLFDWQMGGGLGSARDAGFGIIRTDESVRPSYWAFKDSEASLATTSTPLSTVTSPQLRKRFIPVKR